MKKLSFISLFVLIVLLATIGSAMASESRTVFRRSSAMRRRLPAAMPLAMPSLSSR